MLTHVLANARVSPAASRVTGPHRAFVLRWAATPRGWRGHNHQAYGPRRAGTLCHCRASPTQFVVFAPRACRPVARPTRWRHVTSLATCVNMRSLVSHIVCPAGRVTVAPGATTYAGDCHVLSCPDQRCERASAGGLKRQASGTHSPRAPEARTRVTFGLLCTRPACVCEIAIA